MVKNTVYSRFWLNFWDINHLSTDSFLVNGHRILAGFGGVEPDGEVEVKSSRKDD